MEGSRQHEMSRSKSHRNVPPLIEVLHAIRGTRLHYNTYKYSVLVLTFLCYTAFHAARKPPSIVKSVLKGNAEAGGAAVNAIDGWEPFNGENGSSKLGQVDTAFLGAYAIGMFFAGHLGDRVDLRYFLTVGMLGSGLCVGLFGMGFFWETHDLKYFVIVSLLGGLFQSSGWPSVVSIMANWFGKGKRGLIMGIWNAHTSLGNILGTVIAASVLASGWGFSFVLPGFLIAGLGVLIFCTLVVQPSDIGLPSPYEQLRDSDKDEVSEPSTACDIVTHPPDMIEYHVSMWHRPLCRCLPDTLHCHVMCHK